MKLHTPVQNSTPVQRQASANAGTVAAPNSPRQRLQGEHIAQLQAAAPVQLAGGRVHHDPRKKKHLAKGVGDKQVNESAAALNIKKNSGMVLTNKEAKRMAKEQAKNK